MAILRQNYQFSERLLHPIDSLRKLSVCLAERCLVWYNVEVLAQCIRLGRGNPLRLPLAWQPFCVEEAFDLLKPVTSRLGIRLYLVDWLKALEEAQAALGRFMGNHPLGKVVKIAETWYNLTYCAR